MTKNPLHHRLAKMEGWQHTAFMALLCERMYPNYVFFCQQTQFANPREYRAILDVIWEKLLIKQAKINFDLQLEKLEALIPEVELFDIYAVYPAIDACQGLSHILHGYLCEDTFSAVIAVSQLSISTIIELEEALHGLDLANESRLKENQAVQNEIDLQWDIYRLLTTSGTTDNVALLRELKKEFFESGVSNIGISVL